MSDDAKYRIKGLEWGDRHVSPRGFFDYWPCLNAEYRIDWIGVEGTFQVVYTCLGSKDGARFWMIESAKDWAEAHHRERLMQWLEEVE